MEPTWVAIVVALGGTCTTVIGSIIGWLRGKKKNEADGKKAQVEALAALTDFYKNEILYLRDIEGDNLKALREAEEVIKECLTKSCIRANCSDRINYANAKYRPIKK